MHLVKGRITLLVVASVDRKWFPSCDEFTGGQFPIGSEAFQCQSYGFALDFFLCFSSWLQEGCSNSKHIKKMQLRRKEARRVQGADRFFLYTFLSLEVTLSQDILSAKTPLWTSLATGRSRLRAEFSCTDQWLVIKDLDNWDSTIRKKKGKANGFRERKLCQTHLINHHSLCFLICNDPFKGCWRQ